MNRLSRIGRSDLIGAWENAGKGQPGLEAMGEAYVAFAVTKAWHYRVMFGGGFDLDVTHAELIDCRKGAFGALVDALIEQQQRGTVRREDPQKQAVFVWGVVHGLAMLAIDGTLQQLTLEVKAMARYSMERLRTGIGAPEGVLQAG